MSSPLGDLQPQSRVARVAPLVPDIAAARARGIAWGQIVQKVGPVIGIEFGARGAADALRIAYRAAVRQIERGRLKPEPASAPAPVRPAQPRVTPPATPPMPGQKPTCKTGAGMSDLDAIRREFD